MPDAVTEIADFYLKHKTYFCREALEEAIRKHIEYGTITVLKDENGISGIMRFNIHGDCCHVLDLIIRKDLERRQMIKLIAIHSWAKFPYANFYRFERESKYPGRRPRAYSLAKLLKGK